MNSTEKRGKTVPSLPTRRIMHTWWPLAASWLLMGTELPALSAVVARLADPEINLAAYGGIVFPISLIIESPIIMLLAASTALSRDWESYRKLHRFMMAAGAALTSLHILLAFTPLYDFVARGLFGAPEEIIEPARTGLRIMTPWTWSIAYRRFNQGVLIRFDRSQTVGIGTIVRLSTNLLFLGAGYLIGSIPGIVVATSAVAAGVISEAVYSGLAVRPVLNRQLRQAKPVDEPITLRSFLAFYIPLALTSLITLVVQPIGSAAMSRMPQAIDSLAAWPVVNGLVFMLRSAGMAYNEVVVALLDEPGSSKSLNRFTQLLAAGVTTLLLLIAATPLAGLWFGNISGLNPQLTGLALTAIWIALPLPSLSVYQSWYQGAILFSRRTRGITEAVVIFLAVSSLLLTAGVVWGRATGLYVGLAAFAIATVIQTAWLWFRSRPVLGKVGERDKRLALARSPEAAAD